MMENEVTKLVRNNLEEFPWSLFESSIEIEAAFLRNEFSSASFEESTAIHWKDVDLIVLADPITQCLKK
jgi:hypothetical protein